MSQRGHLVAAALASCSLIAVAATAASAQAGADLSGTWVLNVEDSDETREEFRRWMQSRGAGGAVGGGGAPGTGAGDSPGSPGSGGGGFGGAGAGLMALMERFSQGVERLIIAQSDPEVTITNAAGVANMVFTDGRVIERVDEDGGKTKVKTRWKKDKMIVDIDFPSRPNPAGGILTPSLTMTYSLGKDGRLELASTVGIGAAIPPFTVERVYDREEPAG